MDQRGLSGLAAGLVRRCRHCPHAVEPLVPAAEHFSQQAAGAAGVVVVQLQEAGDVAAERISVEQAVEQPAGGLVVQFSRILHGLAGSAEARRQGQPTGQGHGEAVDCLDLQARRVVGEIPAQRPVAFANRLQMPPERCPDRLIGSPVRVQRCQHPPAHLRCGLAGEGDGQQLLRRLHPGQQPHEPGDQQRGLAGTGRSLDDAGAFGANRRLADALVERRRCLSRRHQGVVSKASRRHRLSRWQWRQPGGLCALPGLWGIDPRLAAAELVDQRPHLSAPAFAQGRPTFVRSLAQRDAPVAPALQPNRLVADLRHQHRLDVRVGERVHRQLRRDQALADHLFDRDRTGLVVDDDLVAGVWILIDSIHAQPEFSAGQGQRRVLLQADDGEFGVCRLKAEPRLDDCRDPLMFQGLKRGGPPRQELTHGTLRGGADGRIGKRRLAVPVQAKEGVMHQLASGRSVGEGLLLLLGP